MKQHNWYEAAQNTLQKMTALLNWLSFSKECLLQRPFRGLVTMGNRTESCARLKYLFKQKILTIKSVVIGSNKNQLKVFQCCRWYTNSVSSTVDNCTAPCLM